MRVALLGGRSRSARAFGALAPDLDPGLTPTAIVRRPAVDDYSDVSSAMLEGVEAAINFVGNASERSEAESRRINGELAVHLADAARAAGVAHFIQLSSLAVYGRAERIDRETPAAPVSAYGRAKLAADLALLALNSDRFRVTVLRVPAIYGRDRPSKLAGLARLLRLVRLFPAPALPARRSVISEQNLVRCLIHLLREPKPGVVLAADPEPFRIDDFARLLPFRTKIVPIPAALLAPVRWCAPGLHASLFRRSEIAPDALLRDTAPPLIPTEAALREAFGP